MMPCGPLPVFGPMPNPNGIKWVITWARTHIEYPLITFKCTTDVPIYLHAQVGCKPPWKIEGEHFKRGIVMHHDPEVIFPFRQSFCQKEHGKTLDHTIEIDCYPDCDIHWWRCIGRDTGFLAKWGASSSGFFNAPCHEEPATELYCNTFTPSLATLDCRTPCERGCAFKPAQNYKLTRVLTELCSLAPWFGPSEFTYCLYLAKDTGQPIYTPIRQKTISSGAWPKNTCRTFDFTIPSIILDKDQTYLQSIKVMEPATTAALTMSDSESCWIQWGTWHRSFSDPLYFDWRWWDYANRTMRYQHWGPPPD